MVFPLPQTWNEQAAESSGRQRPPIWEPGEWSQGEAKATRGNRRQRRPSQHRSERNECLKVWRGNLRASPAGESHDTFQFQNGFINHPATLRLQALRCLLPVPAAHNQVPVARGAGPSVHCIPPMPQNCPHIGSRYG